MIDIKVLGTGCRKCNKLYDEVKRVVDDGGFEANIEKVDKLDDIASYGVMSTPALVVAGQVKSTGKIPKSPQIVSWLEEASK